MCWAGPVNRAPTACRSSGRGSVIFTFQFPGHVTPPAHWTLCPRSQYSVSARSLKCPKQPGPTDQSCSQKEDHLPPWMQETWRNHTAGLRKAKTEPDYLVPDYHRLSTVFLAQMLSKMLDILPRFHTAQEREKKKEGSEGVSRILHKFIIFCDSTQASCFFCDWDIIVCHFHFLAELDQNGQSKGEKNDWLVQGPNLWSITFLPDKCFSLSKFCQNQLLIFGIIKYSTESGKLCYK